MLFPIIKIKNKNKKERIVGSNPHDHLYIDTQSDGSIHYKNLQTDETNNFTKIELVDIEELKEIASQHEKEYEQIKRRIVECFGEEGDN